MDYKRLALRTNIAMSDYKLEDIVVFVDLKLFKGSDRLCKVVELSMQSCGQILQDSFETFETVTRFINPEFERKVDVQTQ